MDILVTTASLLFFSNKTMLLLGEKINKQIGWFFGATGAVLFAIYFFCIGTPILSVAEIGLTVLMTYRFFAGEKTNVSVERFLGVATSVVIIILTIVAGLGIMTLAQFGGAFGMLAGTYLLVSTKQQVAETFALKERIGWLLYGAGHFFTSYVGYQKHEWIFFIFQAWQMMLCFGGFSLIEKNERKLAVIMSLIIGTVAALLFLIVVVQSH